VSYPKTAVKDEYEDASHIGLRNACKDAEAKYDLPAGTLLAIASRETHMKNITGDGGHGRGVFQIDDRYHGEWLRKHGAGEPGQVPAVRDAAFYAASIIAANLVQAKHAGVPESQRTRVAIAGYNAGMTGALNGWRAGNPDANTTGGNYADDVLDRRAVVRDLLPDDKGKGNNGKGHDRVQVSPTGGAVAPTGPPNKIVINPEHLRSMAGVLDRADDAFKDFAHKLATLRKIDLPHNAQLQFASEIAGINVRLRALAPPAHTWAVDLRKRASRVEDPAGKGKGKHSPVKTRHRLAYGSHGRQVRTLQRLLNKLGFKPKLEVDGIFGPKTEAALKNYQHKQHLPVNGVAGDKTWEALLGHPIKIDNPSGGPAAPSTGAGKLPDGFRGRLVELIRTQANKLQPRANKYTQWAGHPAEAWCADFVSWAYAKSGHNLGVKSGVWQWRQYFQAKGAWHSNNVTPVVGAVVCFDWPNYAGMDNHVGIVSRVEHGRVYYISGNTGSPSGGGVGVFEKSVPLANVTGYGWE
jgi:hypothetical protein